MTVAHYLMEDVWQTSTFRTVRGLPRRQRLAEVEAVRAPLSPLCWCRDTASRLGVLFPERQQHKRRWYKGEHRRSGGCALAGTRASACSRTRARAAARSSTGVAVEAKVNW